MKVRDNVGITFDDVLLEPAYSDISSRETIDTSVDFLGLKLRIPIISANMDFVTGSKMSTAMWKAGGLGIIHRFCPWEAQKDNVLKSIGPLTLSVGTRNREISLKRVEWLNDTWYGVKERPIIVCVDVAHGHHDNVKMLIHAIKYNYPDIKVIAGNVATAEGAKFLIDAGADAIKVGIGPGSVCTTRVVTGVGVPQLSAIKDVASITRGTGIPLIADGGIRNSGDIVKALAAGGDVVMLGSLLAGSTECPGTVIETGDGRRLRMYRGQSIFGVNGDKYTKEGVSGYVEEKGPVANVLKQLLGGLRSGMSYVGAHDLRELQEKAIFVRVSPNTVPENHARIALTI